ncbi:MAG: type II toxin-antitoxin system VapC family toxin [Dehalococcoidia bacterium]|nr:type II toxin-antitoxin system VapC family toxin [Dehalococcoidia bacterium]
MPRFYFLDSSALVKRYHEERGTGAVDGIVGGAAPVVVSSLAILEVTAALTRKKNEGRISDDLYSGILGEVTRDFLERFVVLSLDDSLISGAIGLVTERGLRTLDSLQLAAALQAWQFAEELVFVSADRRLNEIAAP